MSAARFIHASFDCRKINARTPFRTRTSHQLRIRTGLWLISCSKMARFFNGMNFSVPSLHRNVHAGIWTIYDIQVLFSHASKWLTRKAVSWPWVSLNLENVHIHSSIQNDGQRPNLFHAHSYATFKIYKQNCNKKHSPTYKIITWNKSKKKGGKEKLMPHLPTTHIQRSYHLSSTTTSIQKILC